MLNDNQKRALYESIMKDVAKVVKKHLNKLSESKEKSNNSFVESFILSLSKMNKSDLIKLKRTFRRNLNESVDTAAQMILNDQSSFATLDWNILDTASNPTPYNEISYGFKTQAIESSSIQPDATKYDSKLFIHHDWPFAINSYIDDVEYLDIIVPNEIKNAFIKDMSQHKLYHKEMPVEISHNLKYILSKVKAKIIDKYKHKNR